MNGWSLVSSVYKYSRVVKRFAFGHSAKENSNKQQNRVKYTLRAVIKSKLKGLLVNPEKDALLLNETWKLNWCFQLITSMMKVPSNYHRDSITFPPVIVSENKYKKKKIQRNARDEANYQIDRVWNRNVLHITHVYWPMWRSIHYAGDNLNWWLFYAHVEVTLRSDPAKIKTVFHTCVKHTMEIPPNSNSP